MKCIRKTIESLGAISLLLAMSPFVGAGEAPASATGQLDLQDCSPPGVVGSAQCATLTVPENRDLSDGRQIALNILVLPAVEEPRVADPMVFLHGGPGGAATDLAVPFSNFRGWKNRDLVFVDQRGTGRSNPLRCDPETFADTMRLVLTFEFQGLEKCAANLDADLTQYTTTIAVEDLEAVRTALGAEQFNLWGGSYGTRVALEYARRHPRSIRSMILRGVGGTTLNVPLHFARSSQIALDEVLDDCRHNEACSRTFPDLNDKYQATLARLASEPQAVSITHPATQTVEEVEVGRQMLAGIVHYLLYARQSANTIPLVIEQASQNEFSTALQIATQLVTQLARLDFGMTLSVVCAEDAPFFDLRDARLLAENTSVGDAFAINTIEACSKWPRGVIPNDYRQPVRSDVPTMLISGSADPVTPYYLAMEATENLSNSLHLVLNDEGHSGIAPGCVQGLMEEFVATGSVSGLDADCGSDFERGAFQGAQ